MKSELFCVCGSSKQFPDESYPELAFIGKSNVGKSSLINMLLNRKGLARTSATPGKTQTINWYKIDDELFFVDLPGYGYAKVSQKEQQRWGRVIETYLHTRKTLAGAVLLVDIRHEPGANDIMMADWLKSYEVPTVVVLTKEDKIKRSQLAHQTAIISKALGVAKSQCVPVSSLNRSGQEVLWARLRELINGQSEEGEPTDGSSTVGE